MVSNKTVKISRARAIALDVLIEVIINKKYSNKLLSKIDIENIILDKDIKLIYKIVYGTLQNKLFLEYIINNFIIQKKTDIKIQILLWLSLYQLVFLSKIPAYAIVNEAVEISKKIHIKYANLVNAVLNKIVRLKDVKKIITNSKIPENKKLLLNYSFPEWIYDMLKEYYNNNDVINFIKDNNNQPKLSYRVNTNKIEFDNFISLFSKRYNFIKSEITNTGIVSSYPLIKTPLFYEGYIIAQDEMSQKIAEILDPSEDDLVLDMCSAPGGKTTHISQLMNNKGRIDAFEIDEKKISLISSNVEKLNCQNIIIKNLNTNNYKCNFLYDKILLDPPCSGLGVIKRKPEIKYINIKKSSIDLLLKKQWELLKTAYKLLKKQGVLVYSTCTVNYEENNQMIKKFVDLYKNMKILKEEQIFGFEKNTDGFYYCKLVKE